MWTISCACIYRRFIPSHRYGVSALRLHNLMGALENTSKLRARNVLELRICIRWQVERVGS